MIKNVIFDLGGILIRFRPLEEIQKLNLTKEKTERLYQCIFCDPLWEEMDAGKYTGISQTFPLYLKKYPDMQEEIKLFFQSHWEDMFCILEDGKLLLERVKNAGYHCYVLSNYSEEAFAYTEKKYQEIFKMFDGKVISGRVHMMKPDSKIYEYLLQKCQLKKEECVFFDDTKKNVDASNAYGIASFVYTDSEKAWCDLQSLI